MHVYLFQYKIWKKSFSSSLKIKTHSSCEIALNHRLLYASVIDWVRTGTQTNEKYIFSRQNQVYPVSLASKLVQHKKNKSIYITNDIQNIWYARFFLFFFLRTVSLPGFWTSRGHRCRPFFPPVLPSIFIAHRVQHSHRSSICHRVLLTHALALSASQFEHMKKSQRIYTSTHSAGLELTKLTYTRLEVNLLRHRGDWHNTARWHTYLAQQCRSTRRKRKYEHQIKKMHALRSNLYHSLMHINVSSASHTKNSEPVKAGRISFALCMYYCA